MKTNPRRALIMTAAVGAAGVASTLAAPLAVAQAAPQAVTPHCFPLTVLATHVSSDISTAVVPAACV